MKGKAYNLAFWLLMCGCIWAGCPITMTLVDDKLKVVNRADYPVAGFTNVYYPDTTFRNSEWLSSIPPGDTVGLHLVNEEWPEALDRSGGVTVFFVHADSASKYFKKSQREGDPYWLKLSVLKKVTLTSSEVDSLNWMIEYP